MIINLSTIDFDGGGGSAKPAKLQEKTTDIEANGTTNVLPDEGFDGISLLSLRANIPNASALNFASIGL